MAGVKRSIETINTDHSVQDDELWSGIKNGDHQALASLYKKYIHDLYNYGFHLVKNKTLVEDAIHDVFETLWNAKTNIGLVQSSKAYLFATLRRKILKQQKTVNQHSNRELNGVNVVFDLEPSHEQTLISKEKEQEQVRKIRNVINKLHDKQREVVYLRFYQNLSYEEISSLMDIGQKYAYNLAHKAFQYIKQNLESVTLLILALGIKVL